MTTTNNSNDAFYMLSSFNDPDRIAVPLVLANAALAMGQGALLWLTLDGVKAARKGAIDDMVSPSFAALPDLLDQFIDAGGKIGICPACAKTHDITEDSLIDNTRWMGAVALQQATRGKQVMSF